VHDACDVYDVTLRRQYSPSLT